ncbi:MAG: hypothetical protein R3F29_06355 [Planctomycetota bacterium]
MNRLPIGLVLALGVTAAASAQTIVTGNISTSTTLTLANSPYQLQGDVYVLPGATLTIEAGVVFRSAANSTLAVCRGAQIFAVGTQDAPITFTSTNDNGTYRVANNEWGNLTLMGSAYVSEDEIPTNTSVPSSTNYADMEGLTPAVVSRNDYGGGDDNDDSGSLAFCSFRYGGIASIPGKELNGLSMGGIGRGTDVHHIEILNNIDDGIETWGGTVNYKYISIWNIGDDSFDVDQGWRGKAQFGLIVQGYSNNGAQGSGFGDNAMEIDGAERCDWQPVTTAAIHNFTVIGGINASGTDKLVELRDNARVQFLNCIFMDGAENVFHDQVTDGEVNNNTTVCGPGSLVPQMLARMTTPASSTYATNAFPGSPELTPAQAYTAQQTGANDRLVQVRGCLFFNNNGGSAYPEAISFGIFPQTFPVAGTNHANNTIVNTSPISSITRGATVNPNGSLAIQPVTFLDPTPANDALTAQETSPNDGFFTAARYRGAFARGNNWLIGWTGTSQYGMTTSSRANEPIHGVERSGANGVPVHYTTGTWAVGTPVTMAADNLDNLGGISAAVLIFGFGPANPLNPTAGLDLNFIGFDNILVPNLDVISVITGPAGSAALGTFNVPNVPAGTVTYSQVFGFDSGLPTGQFTTSNAQRHITQ